jgi:MFS family permease
MNQTNTHHRVLWRQVWGLAALLAALVFGWMAYGFYQPLILTKLGFSQLAGSLGAIQGLLGATIEPLVGLLSDRQQQRIGSRLPAIAVGITSAGLLFIAIGLLLQGDLPVGVRWIIPVLMTVWVIATIVVRGPAVALLRQFAPTAALPAANSILSLTLGLVGSIEPIFRHVIGLVGASGTFFLGALMLTIGAIAMRSTQPRSSLKISLPPSAGVPPRRSIARKIQIFGVGMLAGALVNILLRISPQRLAEPLVGTLPEYLTAGMLFCSAIAAIPLQHRLKNWGLARSMVVSFGAIVLTIGSIALVSHPLFSILAVCMAGVAIGLLSIAQIPWCLGMLAPQQAGLATGLYFGGIGAATALLSLLQLSFRG